MSLLLLLFLTCKCKNTGSPPNTRFVYDEEEGGVKVYVVSIRSIRHGAEITARYELPEGVSFPLFVSFLPLTFPYVVFSLTLPALFGYSTANGMP